MKRHYKYVHKGNPEAKSLRKSKRRTGEVEKSESGGASVAKSSFSSDKLNSQMPVEVEKKGKSVVKSSKQKNSASTLSKGVKVKISKNGLKVESKKKELKNDGENTGFEAKHDKNSMKVHSKTEKVSRFNEAKKFVGKSKKVLTGKKIVLSKIKSSSSSLKNANKLSKSENRVKLSKKKSEYVGAKDAEQKKGEIKVRLKKTDVGENKGNIGDQKRKKLLDNDRNSKQIIHIGSKAARSLEVETKVSGKPVSKLQHKVFKGAVLRKEQEEPMPFKCDECGEGFRNMFNLRKHMPVHSIIKYHCYRCEDVFMNMRSLTKHLLIHEDDEAPINDRVHRCRICSQGFKTTRMLRGHILEHERVEGLESSFATSKSKSTLQGSSPVPVKTSQKSDPTLPSTNSSKLASEDKNFAGKSESTSKSTSGVVDEIAQEAISKKVNDFDSVSSKQLHDSKQNVPSCFSCQLSFYSYAQFKDHVIESHVNLGDLSLQCDKCTEIFMSESEVASHLVKEHNKTFREARLLVRQKEREAVLCGSRAKVPIATQKVGCDTPSVSDISDRCHNAKVNIEQINFPATVCDEQIDSTSYCSGESVDVLKKSANDAIDKSQQFAGIEREEQNKNRFDNDSVNMESQLSCLKESYDLHNDHEGNFSKGQPEEDENLGEPCVDLAPSETYLCTARDEPNDFSKSLANDKSYFLQEQESRDILQALFIEVDDEASDGFDQHISKGMENQAFQNKVKSEDENSKHNMSDRSNFEIDSDAGRRNVVIQPIKDGILAPHGHGSDCDAGNGADNGTDNGTNKCVDNGAEYCAGSGAANGTDNEVTVEYAHKKSNHTKRSTISEGNGEETGPHNNGVIVAACRPGTGTNRMNEVSLSTDEDVFLPFVRRQASISGERRILEAINAGRKACNSRKRTIAEGNNLDSNGCLINAAGNDSPVSAYSKPRHEKFEAVNARSTVKGKKRKSVQDSEYGYQNDEQCRNNSTAVLERNEKTKAVRPHKKKRSRWMFGKIRKYSNRKRAVKNQTRRNSEELTLRQMDHPVLISSQENPPEFPLSKSCVELGDPQEAPCNAVNVDDKALQSEEFQLNKNVEDVDVTKKQESTTIDTENVDLGGCNSSHGEDVKSIPHVDSEALKKIHKNSSTGKNSSKNNVAGKVAPKEITQLASLIYVPRRAAVAGQGKIQQASRSRKMGSHVSKNVGKTCQKNTEVSVPLMFDSSRSQAVAKSQSTRQKSGFTNLQRIKAQKTSHRANRAPNGERFSSDKNKLCICCSSVSCVKFANGGPNFKDNSAIASSRKKKVAGMSDENKKLGCDVCGKTFNTMYFLRLHEKRHTNDSQAPKAQMSRNRRTVGFQCKICTVVLPSKLALVDHLKTSHDGGRHQKLSSIKLKTKRSGLQGHVLKSKQALK